MLFPNRREDGRPGGEGLHALHAWQLRLGTCAGPVQQDRPGEALALPCQPIPDPAHEGRDELRRRHDGRLCADSLKRRSPVHQREQAVSTGTVVTGREDDATRLETRHAQGRVRPCDAPIQGCCRSGRRSTPPRPRRRARQRGRSPKPSGPPRCSRPGGRRIPPGPARPPRRRGRSRLRSARDSPRYIEVFSKRMRGGVAAPTGRPMLPVEVNDRLAPQRSPECKLRATTEPRRVVRIAGLRCPSASRPRRLRGRR